MRNRIIPFQVLRNPDAPQQTPQCGLGCYRGKIQAQTKYLESQTFIIRGAFDFIELCLEKPPYVDDVLL
jgi:hypothetical protein